jgi:hypothetical protein
MVTATTMPNLYFHDRSFGRVHLLKAYAGDPAARATIVQDASEESAQKCGGAWLADSSTGSSAASVAAGECCAGRRECQSAGERDNTLA